jgi:hypothetical protein
VILSRVAFLSTFLIQSPNPSNVDFAILNSSVLLAGKFHHLLAIIIYLIHLKKGFQLLPFLLFS